MGSFCFTNVFHREAVLLHNGFDNYRAMEVFRVFLCIHYRGAFFRCDFNKLFNAGDEIRRVGDFLEIRFSISGIKFFIRWFAF